MAITGVSAAYSSTQSDLELNPVSPITVASSNSLERPVQQKFAFEKPDSIQNLASCDFFEDPSS